VRSGRALARHAKWLDAAAPLSVYTGEDREVKVIQFDKSSGKQDSGVGSHGMFLMSVS
jgi:hypothetical protein